MVKSVNTIQKIAIKEGVGTNFCEYNRDLYKKLSLEKDEGRVKGGEEWVKRTESGGRGKAEGEEGVVVDDGVGGVEGA